MLKAVGFVNGDDGKLHWDGWVSTHVFELASSLRHIFACDMCVYRDDMGLIESTLHKLTQAEAEYRQKNPTF